MANRSKPGRCKQKSSDTDNTRVAELKKVLKEKDLATTGSKSELQERLTLSLTTDSQTAEPEINDAVLTETKNANSNEPEVQVSQLSPKAVKPTEEKEHEPIVPVSEEPSRKITGPVSTTLSEEERIKKRTERFGVVNEDAKKQARAERFGVSAVKSSSVGSPGGVSTDILKKRAERFGQVVSSGLSKENEAEKILKRKERFGEVTSSANNTPSKFAKITFDSSPAEDLKKKKRAERFGLS